MSEIKDGGAAFPHVLRNEYDSATPGMTLRDYMAAKALEGIAMRFDLMGRADNSTNTPDVVARFCYQLADSMIRARGAA